jgi:hypothetical protein
MLPRERTCDKRQHKNVEYLYQKEPKRKESVQEFPAEVGKFAFVVLFVAQG